MDTSTKNYDFTKVITKEHAGKWVALSPDHASVVDYADDLETLEGKVGGREVVFMRVRKPGIAYAFKAG